MNVLWGIAGMLGLLAIAFACSTNRRAIKPRTVASASALQMAFGVVVLFIPAGRSALRGAAAAVQAVIDSSKEGIGFLFGTILPKDGIVFAFQVLPVIVFFASLTSILYHLGWLQKVVEVLGGALARLLGTERAESVNAAANIFLGQTEAPLVIKPYLPGLTRSGLFAVMVGGLSTVAGSVLVGYALLGANLDYLIAASFMAAPGALLMAKIMVPEDGTITSPVRGSGRDGSGTDGSGADGSGTDGSGAVDPSEQGGPAAETEPAADAEPARARNVIDAAATGAAEGLKLALNIGAMLLAFISLIALLNLILGALGGLVGHGDLTFQTILGYAFAPVMTMIGVPWGEAAQAGSFVGQKVIVNEFVAFSAFGPVEAQLSEGLTTAHAAGIISIYVVAGMILGPIIGDLSRRLPNHRSLALVLPAVGVQMAAWIAVIALPGPAPDWLLWVLAVALATGGPASMIAFDHARTHNPVHRLSTATGVTNAGGFIAALIAVFVIGLLLDAQGAGTPDTYTLDAFRVAFLTLIPLWVIGVVFILIERKRTRIRMGLEPDRRR